MLRSISGVLGLVALGVLGCSSQVPGGESKTEGLGIIGGDPDTTSHAIFAIQNDAGGLCTGSLIAPNLILTAQHCVAALADPEGPVECPQTEFTRVYPASDFLVSWDANLGDGVPQNTIHEVNLVVTPEDPSLCGNDIAMLRLSDNVPPEQAVPIIPRVDSRPEVDELFDAVGYGIQNPNDNQGSTAGVRMRVNDNLVGCVGVQCTGTGATNTEWAAEAPICSGDSGGPALDSQGRVIGIVSRGDPDCTVGIYGAVDSWKTLIVDTAVDAADDGDYPPPAWTGMGGGMAGMGGGGGMAGGSMGGSSGTGGSTAGTGGSAPNAGNGGTGGSTAGTGGSMAGSGPSSGGAAGSNATGGTGNTMDAGVPPLDSGVMPLDSGTPPDAGGGLGSPCDNMCAPGYLCWSASSQPPGICVPPCDSGTACPADYRCSTAVGVCTPKDEGDDDDDTTDTSAGCGCRTAPNVPGAPWATFATLLGLVTVAVRRRRSPRSRSSR
jgi:MYXO-CTERM domain-containing protein